MFLPRQSHPLGADRVSDATQELSDDLVACIAQLMAEESVPHLTAVRQRHYITYTLPTAPLIEEEPSGIVGTQFAGRTPKARPIPAAITILESQDVLAAAGTTGRRTWEAALELGTLLVSPDWAPRIRHKTILELGAGTGLLTILCAKYLEATHVLATDGSGEVVDDLGQNLFLNSLDATPGVKTAVVKWGHGLVEETLNGTVEHRDYDFVLGSDLV